MTTEFTKLKAEAEEARRLYIVGEITRQEAIRAITPYAEAFNKKAGEIAGKYNQRPQRFSVTSYLR